MYEVRGQGLLRFVIAPFVGMFLPATVLLIILLAVSGWFWLITLVYLAWIEWRASRLSLRADGSGISVVNLVRRYEIAWEKVRATWADESW
jgi:hypothetical protein